MQPTHIGRYEIVTKIGQGGMGVVYLGKDTLIGRDVAIKTIRPGVADGSPEFTEFSKRFNNEARAAGGLAHPNIVTVYDVGEHEGLPFIAMEFVRGAPLSHFLKKGKRFGREQIWSILNGIAVALDYAHRNGVVHRDLKPQNIMVSESFQVKIVDFGIARVQGSNMTGTGTFLGTPNYIAPEQARGERVDHRADLFSLGVIAFEIVTGKQPFSGSTFTAVLMNIVGKPPQIPEGIEQYGLLPKRVSETFAKALAKEPQDRYQSAQELVASLSPLLYEYQAPLEDFSVARGAGDDGDLESDEKEEQGAEDAEQAEPVDEQAMGLDTVGLGESAPVAAKPPVPDFWEDENDSLLEDELDTAFAEAFGEEPARPAGGKAVAKGARAAAAQRVAPIVQAAREEMTRAGTSGGSKKVPPAAAPEVSVPRPASRSEPEEMETRAPAAAPAAMPEPLPTELRSAAPGTSKDVAAEVVAAVSTAETSSIGAEVAPESKARRAGAKTPLLVAAVVIALVAAAMLIFGGEQEPVPGQPTPDASAVRPAPPQDELAPAEVATPEPTFDQPTPLAGKATLVVASVPHGATVKINGEDKGVTPLVLPNLEPERLTLTIEKGGYRSKETTVELKKGEHNVVQMELDPLGGVGTIVVNSVPDGARVYLNESAVGMTPAKLGKTEAGAYTVRISKQGYVTAARKVQLERDEVESVLVTLDRSPENAAAAATPPAATTAVKPAVEQGLAQPTARLAPVAPRIIPPRLREKSDPECPELSRRLRHQGTIELSFVVAETGAVKDVKIEKSLNAVLDRAALRAVERWKYEPATTDGTPIAHAHKATIEITCK